MNPRVWLRNRWLKTLSLWFAARVLAPRPGPIHFEIELADRGALQHLFQM
jgi:hypothetical protein